MVKVGHFTVQLVRADTKEPFKEHTKHSNEHIYAEVEPDVDYFVCVGSTRYGGAQVRLMIDGVPLGYRQSYLKTIPKRYLGNLERKDGVSSMTALRFNRVSIKKRDDGEGSSSPSMLTGKVTAEFYAPGEKKYKKAKDVSHKQLSGIAKEIGGKKCVKSGNGSHIHTKKRIVKDISVKKGDKLCTITIHYCTTLGLIVNNILNAPPPGESEIEDVAPVVSTAVKSENSKCKRESMSDEEDEDPIAVTLVEKKKNPCPTVDLTEDKDEKWI